MSLTDTTIKRLKTTDKPYRIADGKGLYLEVTPAGGKLWRWAYRFNGRQKKMGFGQYPNVALADARDRHHEATRLLASGVDPMVERKLGKARTNKKPHKIPAVQPEGTPETLEEITLDSPFRVLALSWFHHWNSDKAPKHAKRTCARLEANLFPTLGDLPISRIEPRDIIRMVKTVEARGVNEVARRSLELTKQIFEYGIAHDYVKISPAAAVRPKLVLQSYKTKHQARVGEAELPALLRDIDGYQGRALVTYALQLMALTFLRTDELTGAEWREFDFARKQWKVPALRMKMDQEHIVPLSNQAIEVLKRLKTLSGNSPYVFPGAYKHTGTMNNNALLEALYEMGYKGKQTGHGFRGLASTILHEQGFPHEHVELQLAHTPKDKVSAAYNYALYLEPRAQMMQAWADYLDSLRQPAN